MSGMSAFGGETDIQSPMSVFCRFMSVIGGKADVIAAKADIGDRMSDGGVATAQN